ncbi:MAG: molybdenum cofactor guanylyltransferase [Bacteroidales bacterium]
MADRVTGIILAGGTGSRMGQPKPFIPWKGKQLIEWVFQAIQPVCGTIIIVANRGDFGFLKATVIPDNFTGQGPAAGIEAGLAAMKTVNAVVVSCDTPNLSTGLFRYLLEQHGDHEITIASHESITEPLIGIYSKAVAERFKAALEAGDPHPPRIIRGCRWQAVPISPENNFFSPDLFLNLNSPKDLR